MFRKNQALLRRCTKVDGAIKKNIVMAVQQVFLSPIMDQLTRFGKLTALKMLQHLLISYRNIEKHQISLKGDGDRSDVNIAKVFVALFQLWYINPVAIYPYEPLLVPIMWHFS